MVDLLDGAEAQEVGQPAGEVDYIEEIRGEGWHARRSVTGVPSGCRARGRDETEWFVMPADLHHFMERPRYRHLREIRCDIDLLRET